MRNPKRGSALVAPRIFGTLDIFGFIGNVVFGLGEGAKLSVLFFSGIFSLDAECGSR